MMSLALLSSVGADSIGTDRVPRFFLSCCRRCLLVLRRFEGIDSGFKDLMKSISLTPTVIVFCSEVTLLNG